MVQNNNNIQGDSSRARMLIELRKLCVHQQQQPTIVGTNHKKDTASLAISIVSFCGEIIHFLYHLTSLIKQAMAGTFSGPAVIPTNPQN